VEERARWKREQGRKDEDEAGPRRAGISSSQVCLPPPTQGRARLGAGCCHPFWDGLWIARHNWPLAGWRFRVERRRLSCIAAQQAGSKRLLPTCVPPSPPSPAHGHRSPTRTCLSALHSIPLSNPWRIQYLFQCGSCARDWIRVQPPRGRVPFYCAKMQMQLLLFDGSFWDLGLSLGLVYSWRGLETGYPQYETRTRTRQDKTRRQHGRGR
jgi:hypothetical protein